MKNPLFFDHASTTPACPQAVETVRKYANEEFGNPSSAHALGQKCAQAIRDARKYFAHHFRVEPEQVIFTGGGTESDNLAIQGTALRILSRAKNPDEVARTRVLASATEHPAVTKTVTSLKDFGFDCQFIPVKGDGQIDLDRFSQLLSQDTAIVSIQQVNNILGTVHPVEDLARFAKKVNPSLIFHTDAVQAFGKVPSPKAPSPVDLVSISAHKIGGPKGVGALIALNPAIVKQALLRPLIWGGGQEDGMRSGTQNAGLIAGFHLAAEETIKATEARQRHLETLNKVLKKSLIQRNLLSADPKQISPLVWNSSEKSIPGIVSLSAPGLPSSSLAMLLEQRGIVVSTGSACSSKKMEPDSVLSAMGCPLEISGSAIRISMSHEHTEADISTLAATFDDAVQLMTKLYKPRREPH
ncbi:cysteine desulfurase [bacterium]|nr:cysteine desulfurase [bacterium]